MFKDKESYHTTTIHNLKVVGQKGQPFQITLRKHGNNGILDLYIHVYLTRHLLKSTEIY